MSLKQKDWTELDVQSQTIPPHQTESLHRRTSDGLVIAVMKGMVTGARYAVLALPENFEDDFQPVRSVGDDGYLWVGDNKTRAEAARDQFIGDGRVNLPDKITSGYRLGGDDVAGEKDGMFVCKGCFDENHDPEEKNREHDPIEPITCMDCGRTCIDIMESSSYGL